jgi:hypothetical protein
VPKPGTVFDGIRQRPKNSWISSVSVAKKNFQAAWWTFFQITRTVMAAGPIRPKTRVFSGKNRKSPPW